MPKLNLAQTRKVLTKKIAKKGFVDELVWYISKEHQKKIYYVQEVNRKTGAVTWTTRRKWAIQFRTNGAVYQFISKFMNDRNDVALINAPEED